MSDAALKLTEQIRAIPDEEQRFICDRLWEPCPLADDPLGDLPDSEDYPGPSIYRPPEEWDRAFIMRRERGTEPPLPTPPPSALALDLWDQVAAAHPDDRQFIADELYQHL